MPTIRLALLIVILPYTLAARTLPPGALTPEDLISVDPLGYVCIAPAYFVEPVSGGPAPAFALGGKLRVERTCLPDPCTQALTRSQLSGLTGTSIRLARFEAEWTDYYVRYADYCRRETTPIYDGIQSAQTPSETFWAPVLDTSVDETLRSTNVPQTPLTPTVVSVPGLVLPLPGRTVVLPRTVTTAELTQTDDGGSSTNGTAPEEGILNVSSDDLAVVPVPASGYALAFGVLVLALQSWRRKSGLPSRSPASKPV